LVALFAAPAAGQTQSGPSQVGQSQVGPSQQAPGALGPAWTLGQSSGETGSSASTGTGESSPETLVIPNITPPQLPDLTKRENFSAALQILILLTVLSLAPAIMIMMTSFTRIIIVLSLLRQALGTQQLPPNQILVGLAMFMTFLVMGPTFERVNREALQPYMNADISQQEAL